MKALIEKQSKDETNRKNKIIKEQKRSMMMNKIIKKNTKIIYKPYHKLNFTPLFISNQFNKKNQIRAKNTENEYEALITY